MALEIPNPPEESRKTLVEGLRRLAPRAKGTFMSESLGGAPPEIANAHQVFILSPQAIADSRDLSAAKAVGWGYVVNQPATNLSSGSSVVAAEVLERGGGHAFSNMQQGWIGRATQRTIAVAKTLPQVIAGSYELRMLRIPALYTDTLWLKDRVAANDLIVPIASASNQVRADQPYTVINFLSLMRDLIGQKKGFDNSPKV